MQLDVRGPRFAASVTSVVLIAVLITGNGWLALTQTAVFALGRGPARVRPYGVVFRVAGPAAARAAPRARAGGPVPVRPGRRLRLRGGGRRRAAGRRRPTAVGLVAASLALVAAFLNAAFGLCLGCEAYLLLRRLTHPGSLTGDSVLSAGSVRLRFREPLDRAALLGFLGHRAIAGVDEVIGDTYRRAVCGCRAARPPLRSGSSGGTRWRDWSASIRPTRRRPGPACGACSTWTRIRSRWTRARSGSGAASRGRGRTGGTGTRRGGRVRDRGAGDRRPADLGGRRADRVGAPGDRSARTRPGQRFAALPERATGRRGARRRLRHADRPAAHPAPARDGGGRGPPPVGPVRRESLPSAHRLSSAGRCGRGCSRSPASGRGPRSTSPCARCGTRTCCSPPIWACGGVRPPSACRTTRCGWPRTQPNIGHPGARTRRSAYGVSGDGDKPTSALAEAHATFKVCTWRPVTIRCAISGVPETYLRPYYGQYIRLIVAGGGRHRRRHRHPAIWPSGWSTDRSPQHDPAGLWCSEGSRSPFGLIEAPLNFYRRWAQAGSALGMETPLRNDLYAHLQRLPVAFHDGWQSGQLLSRATTDLRAIRRFLSFGLIFLVINVATFVTVLVLLLRLYWPLGLLVAASAVPLFIISARFTARLQRDVPADAGPAGRPGHPGRGDGRRHPGDQGVRPARPHVGAVRRARSATAARHGGGQGRAWSRRTWSHVRPGPQHHARPSCWSAARSRCRPAS